MITEQSSRYDGITLPQSILVMLDGTNQDSGQEDQLQFLRGMANEFNAMIKEAVNYRRTSGIEDVMLACEEAYIGIDDGNRHEYRGARWTKPFTTEGALIKEGRGAGAQEGSSLYYKLTARYVNMAAAKAAEILLMTGDDKPFSIGPTPIAELTDMADDQTPVTAAGIPLQRDATPQEAQLMSGQSPQPVNPGNPSAETPTLPQPPGSGPGVPLTVGDLVKEKQEQAEEAGKKAEKRIHDWMIEARYSSQARRGLHDASKLGVMVIKGPIPKFRREMAFRKGENGQPPTLEIVDKIIPSWERKNPWCIYPAPTCGEVISEGPYVVELDMMSKVQLAGLVNLEGYQPSELNAVLKETPGRRADTRDPSVPTVDDRYEVWHITGMIEKEKFAALQKTAIGTEEDKEADLKEIKGAFAPIQATIVNDRVIRCVMSPLHSGKIPYYNMPWTVREGSWVGVGVAEQVDPAQRLATGTLRALSDNLGIAAGVNLVIDENIVEPADNSVAIGRNKRWRVKSTTGAPDDIRKAFYQFQVRSIQADLEAVLNRCDMMAEQFCSVPLISQGQSGPNMPETATGHQLQETNAQQLLRDVAARYDDYINTLNMAATYEWLLLDPTVPNEEKGDFQIFAQGSQALANRVLQRQIIGSVGNATLNQAFGLSPRKWMTQYLRSNFIRPSDLQYDPAEQQKLDSTPPPKPYQVQVAEIQAQGDEQDRQIRLEIEMLKYANQNKITLTQVKAQLADTAMKLKTQEKLAAVDASIDLHKHHNPPPQALTPPTEPPGRAEPGKSFQQ